MSANAVFICREFTIYDQKLCWLDFKKCQVSLQFTIPEVTFNKK